MKKPTYEEQNAFLSKYVAPVFMDLDGVLSRGAKKLWEKYITIPAEIRDNKTPKAREEMQEAGVYDSLERLELETALGDKTQRIIMGDVLENEKVYSLVSDLSEYRDDRQFSRDVCELGFELAKKPVEVLEIRINREIMKYFQEALGWDTKTQFKRKFLIRDLLRLYKFKVNPKDRDLLYQAHLKAFDVRDDDYLVA